MCLPTKHDRECLAPLQLAPISVLEFAQLALDAGGTSYSYHPLEYISICVQVPSGVLSVLPGPGATTGKELVSHPLIRKVDVTVAHVVLLIAWDDS